MDTGFEPLLPRVTRGDRLIVHAHRQGQPQRDAEILEVLGDDGRPPYHVRWSDDGHETIVYPGSDASIVHTTHKTRPAAPKRVRH